MSFIKSFRTVGLILFCVAYFLICGCINNKILVSAETSPAVDFKKYKKYTFVDFFIPQNPRDKFHIYNDFRNKSYTLEIIGQKLKTMGFVRNDENPDFAVWVGSSIEFADFSRKNKSDGMKIIPAGRNYLLYANDLLTEDLFERHIKVMGICFFYVKDIPRSADIKKLCALSETFIKIKDHYELVTDEEDRQILQEMYKLYSIEDFIEPNKETQLKNYVSKYPCSLERKVWSGFVGYFSKTPYLEEERIPILVDVLLDSYPYEHIPLISDHSIREIPKWFKEIDF